jgi:SAM-dependent methyltransferase
LTGTAFDHLAARYDKIWTLSSIGRNQRQEVWRVLDPLVQAGDFVLDLGCGTGEDALHFMDRGAHVHGVDASHEMVRIARARGVDAQPLPLECIGKLRGTYDAAISNFGVFNCIQRLDRVAVALEHLIRPGGYLAICIMGRVCVWETCYFLCRGRPAKAFRRWPGSGAASSLDIQIHYPSIKQLVHTFKRNFRLLAWQGVGLCVPPSFISGFSETTIDRLAALDRRIIHWPLLRALSDHRLVLFQRL